MAGLRIGRPVRRAVAWLRYAFRLGRLARFLGYAARRFLADGCPLQAAGLGYVSLLAVVPLALLPLLMTLMPATQMNRRLFMQRLLHV